jgi:hypothetical protein
MNNFYAIGSYKKKRKIGEHKSQQERGARGHLGGINRKI